MIGSINLVAVLLAVLGSVVFMFIWYGAFFWDLWAKYAKVDMSRGKVWQLRVILWTAWVNFIGIAILSVLLQITSKLWFMNAIEFTYLLWLWFAVPFGIWEVVVKNGSLWATLIELWAFLWELLVAAIILGLFL
jgi:hypothetical protein